jgi:cytidine deaminase
MTVVPADEFGGGMAVREVFARYSHFPVGARAIGQNDAVVGFAQIGDQNAGAVLM